MLEFARWKYILVAVVMVFALLIAAPNFFGEDDAVQVARRDRAAIDATALKSIEDTVTAAGAKYKRAYIDEGRAMLLFDDTNAQQAARDTVNTKLKDTYV